MVNAFVKRLQGHGELTEADLAELRQSCRNTRDVPANYHLIREGDKPDPVFVMLRGWACRYKMLPDGSRQITSFMLPGDFCDVHIATLQTMDHDIMTVSKARVAYLPRAEMEALVTAGPRLTQAFWWTQLVDQAVLRTWIVSMGRRRSIERVAHLMCELYIRMRRVSLTTNHHCEMPLSQIVLADALGLTPVHVNRVLKVLRTDKIMELKRGSLTIIDPMKLAKVAGFDDGYLHARILKSA